MNNQSGNNHTGADNNKPRIPKAVRRIPNMETQSFPAQSGTQSAQPRSTTPTNTPARAPQPRSTTPANTPARAPQPRSTTPSNTPARAPQPRSTTPANTPARTPAAKPVARNAARLSPAAGGASADDNEKTRLNSTVKTDAAVYPPDEDGVSQGISGLLKALIYMISIIVISVACSYFIIVVANDVFAFVKSDEVVEVNIPEQATISQIADILAKKKIIAFPALFEFYAARHSSDNEFVAGTYSLNAQNNYLQLLGMFKEQTVRSTVWVTIPEGYTVDEIIDLLVNENGISNREDFISAINDYDYGLDFVNEIKKSDERVYRLEGYLFPDTYQFYTDSTPETVIYKMLTNFKRKISYIDYEERLSELSMTLDEVITLSSMIEEEAKYSSDFEYVSSVFHNRLNNQASFPRLESDATVFYAVQIKTGVRPLTITAADLDMDSAYNTRKSHGLPPGPISNAGYEAIYCAFYPAKTSYYYFVTDNDGYNVFTKTLNQHNAAVAKVAAGANAAKTEG